MLHQRYVFIQFATMRLHVFALTFAVVQFVGIWDRLYHLAPFGLLLGRYLLVVGRL